MRKGLIVGDREPFRAVARGFIPKSTLSASSFAVLVG
jgi:hypothetical protein